MARAGPTTGTATTSCRASPSIKDLLIALYRLPDDDRMGFTHAYFPTYAFDEWTIKGDWAFARRGDGYLAIGAQHGLQLSTRGKNAYRELRSYGLRNVWLVQMGRRALDGSSYRFQEKVLALPVNGAMAAWCSPRCAGRQLPSPG